MVYIDVLIDDENDNGPTLPAVLRTCRKLKKENNYHMVDLNESDKGKNLKQSTASQHFR